MNFLNKLSIRVKILSGMIVSILAFAILIYMQFGYLFYLDNQIKSLKYIEKAKNTINQLSVINQAEKALLLELIHSDDGYVVKHKFEEHVFTLNKERSLFDSVFKYVGLIYKEQNNNKLASIVNSTQGAFADVNVTLKSYFKNSYLIKQKQIEHGDNLLDVEVANAMKNNSPDSKSIIPVEVDIDGFEGHTRSVQLSKIYYFYSKSANNIDNYYNEIFLILSKEYAARNAEVIAEGKQMKSQNGLFFIAMLVIFVIMTVVMTFILTIPLNKLGQITLKLSKGELLDNFEAINSNDELGNMSKALSALSDGLRKKSNFAVEIGQRNFVSDFKPLGEKDVLGNVLLDMRDSLKVASMEEDKRKDEDKERAWTTEGLALFGDILRKHTENIGLLSSVIISNLVSYLNINQGGIFILNDSDPENVFLELAAAYAYSREKFMKKQILLGEGLVGGVAVEKYTFYTTDLPEEYINIESGIGGGNPKSLLIVPLKLDNEVLGVIELASFNEIQKHEIELVERIAESIASTLSTARINTTTADLLEQSKIREQEMQERENEMQSRINAMKISEEELKRKEQELTAEVVELESIRQSTVAEFKEQSKRLDDLVTENHQFKKDIDKVDKQINQIFKIDLFPLVVVDKSLKITAFNKVAEDITGYSVTELIGRDIDVLFDSKVAEDIRQHVGLYFETKQIGLIERSFSVELISKLSEKIPVKFKMREISINDHTHLALFMNNLNIVKDLENQLRDVNENLMTKEFDYTIRINSLEHFINQNGLIIPLDLEASTDLMRWNVSHSIGLNIIDNQHKRWIEFINVLYKAYKLNSKKDVVLEHIDKLLDYSDYHFGFEEKYMEDFKCGVLHQHVKSHKHFVDTIKSLRAQYKRGDKNALYKLIILLHNLSSAHIEESREYVSCFKKNGFS